MEAEQAARLFALRAGSRARILYSIRVGPDIAN
jgi:hypothetical protein